MNIDPQWIRQHTEMTKILQRTYAPMIQNLERTFGPMIRQQQAILRAIEPQLKLAEMVTNFDRLIGPAMRETMRIQVMIEKMQFAESARAFAKLSEAIRPALESIERPDPALFLPPPQPVENPQRDEIEDLENRVNGLETALIELQIELARKLPEVDVDE